MEIIFRDTVSGIELNAGLKKLYGHPTGLVTTLSENCHSQKSRDGLGVPWGTSIWLYGLAQALISNFSSVYS